MAWPYPHDQGQSVGSEFMASFRMSLFIAILSTLATSLLCSSLGAVHKFCNTLGEGLPLHYARV